MKKKILINFFLVYLLVCLSQGIDIDTGSLGDAGVKIYCSTLNVQFGYSIKAIGDVNGDGVSEFIIGIPNYNDGQGMIAIVYGNSRSSLTTFDICTDNDDIKGYTITGEPGQISRFGISVSGAGDINGDGIPDIVVGARYYPGGGRAYIIFLNKRQTLTTIFTSPFTTEGYILTTNSGGSLGFRVDGGKDVNNDGIPDVFISAHLHAPGRVYIFYGTGANDGTTLNLETAPSNIAYSIEGVSGTNFGVTLAMCEDLNNDKISDLVVANIDEGGIYVIYGTNGKTRSSQTNADIINSGNNGFKISGAGSSFTHSWAFSCGDINDDKARDIAVGSTWKISGVSGRVDVVFGATAASVSSFHTMNTPTEGFRITGSTPPDFLGQGIDMSGDINGDLIADIVFTAPEEDSGKGAVYVLFGSKTTLDDIVANDISPQSKGFKIIGSTTSSNLGDAVASNMDLDCDGIDDILVSSMAESAVYLIYGTGSATKHMTNDVCCDLGFEGTNGHCCPSDQIYDTSSSSCICSTPGYQLSNGHCCLPDQFYDTLSSTCVCSTPGYHISNEYCCPSEQIYDFSSSSCVCSTGYQLSNGCPSGQTFDGSTCKTSSNPPNNKNNQSSLTTAQKVGIIVGSSIVGIAFFSLLGYGLWRYKMSKLHPTKNKKYEASGQKESNEIKHMPIPTTPATENV